MSTVAVEDRNELDLKVRQLAGALEQVREENARLRSERAVASSGQRLKPTSMVNSQRMLDCMTDAFNVVTIDGHLVEFNHAYQAMLGYSAEELTRLTYTDLTPEKWHRLEADIIRKQTLKRGYSDVYEKEYRRKDGAVFPVELRTFLIRDDAGQPCAMWAIVRDITERKRMEMNLRESEARFMTVLQQSVDVAYRRNLKADRYDYMSPAIERITGYTAEEFSEIKFRDLLDMIHPDDLPSALARLEQMTPCNKGVPVDGFIEFRLRRKDGEYRWLSDSARIIVADDGTPLYHIGTVRDITERKRMEDALRVNNEWLEKTVAERTARLRRLATELTLAEQRERKRLSEFLHDDLQQVLVAAKYRSEKFMAEQPTEALQQEAGKLHNLLAEALNKTRSICKDLSTPLLYVAGFAPALQQLAEQMRERHNLHVEVDIEGVHDLPQEDTKVQLFHSVRELLFNVIKHADTSNASVRIATRDGQLEITVSDKGKGFDQNRTPPENHAACGYGLFSINERLGAIGGHLTINSTPGSGSCITIRAPVASEPSAAPPAPSCSAQKERPLRAANVRIRVLVADDHDLVRYSVTEMFTQDPAYEVVGEAVNGLDALTLTRELRPDVVVMDVRMPKMDGIEATRLIKTEFPETLVIGISAFSEKGFKTELLKAGAVDLIGKADANQRLIATIRRALDAGKDVARSTH
jgi:PAS domain S-box-containing protein